MTTEQKKALYLTYIFHALSIIDISERVGEEWISKETKMRFNNFLKDFQKANKKNMEEAFNVNADGESGDAFLQGMEAVDFLAKTISAIPYAYFPDIVMLIEAYKKGDIKLKTEVEQ